eukprot:TRINITY_DN4945_c5_g1_i1.p1 TRINITY_DN4945_c5_g1~~TRINITY_DN4945_c5_g1_i1.p1  ORF type:complete len:526 (+),score=210.84 TRINITY_DN4945_c5_g1_i1:103-1578(+)
MPQPAPRRQHAARAGSARPRVVQSRTYEPPPASALSARGASPSRAPSQRAAVGAPPPAAPQDLAYGRPVSVSLVGAAQGQDDDLARDARASREECRRLRQELASRETQVRELKIKILELTDYIDTTALKVEEEKHELRQRTEMEARSYRGRQQNMNNLIAQLRQEVDEAQGRAHDVGAERDRLLKEKEGRARELIHAEQHAAELQRRLSEQDRELSAARLQREQWTKESESMADRVARAEELMLEMRSDCTRSAERCEQLRADCNQAHIRAEELQLQVLQAQRREADLRQSLAEVGAASGHVSELRRECDELRERDRERQALIDELRLEKHKMMQHLQAGIRERQEVIDSVLSRGGGGLDGSPELRLKIVEVEQLRAELAHCVQKADEEAAAQRDLTGLLQDRADAAEARYRQVRDENQRLRAELELATEGAKDLQAVRLRYQRTTEELEAALRDVGTLRRELHQEREMEEQALRERFERSAAHLSQSPER